MASKIFFECSNCQYQSPKYLGKCPQCDSWNTMEEISNQPPNDSNIIVDQNRIPINLKDIDHNKILRINSNVSEFDRSLGGGVVPGSVILIGGEPGVGKSTLLLNVSGNLSSLGKVLYYSGEESETQIKLRADRIGIDSKNIFLLTMGDLEDIKLAIKEISPKFIIIDSIQTMNSRSIGGFSGSIGKLRQITSELIDIAKSNNTTVFIIGHITKDGQIAGPKTLEHMVDVVLYFQGELQSNLKVLRVEKNRFGSVNELGIFQMSSKGLSSVTDPSEVFLQKRGSGEAGTSVVASMKGMRSLLIEIQALVTENPFGGNPRRMSIGFDPYRLSMLISVIEKKLRFPFYKSDVFLNITGGITLKETASDLAVCFALISSQKNINSPIDTIFLGEVGLTGEIRPVSFIENRIKESVNHGFKKFILPKSQSELNIKGTTIFPVRDIKDFYSTVTGIISMRKS